MNFHCFVIYISIADAKLEHTWTKFNPIIIYIYTSQDIFYPNVTNNITNTQKCAKLMSRKCAMTYRPRSRPRGRTASSGRCSARYRNGILNQVTLAIQ